MTVGDVYDLAPGLAATAEVGRSDTEFARFALPYRIAVSMLTTKVSILKEKFTDRDGHCPIAAVSSRVRTLDSIRRRAQRICCPLTVDDVRTNILDIAGSASPAASFRTRTGSRRCSASSPTSR